MYNFGMLSVVRLVCGAVLLCCPLLLAEDGRTISSRGRIDAAGSIRVDSALVLIPVHVTTPYGASVTDLEKKDFTLFEDGVQQPIGLFAKDDGPISIGLLFDASGSMHNKMAKVTEAAASFFKTANKDDEFFLVEFNERARVTVPFTSDIEELEARIERNRPFGETALLDAFHVALKQMKHARNLRKAFVVLSDGGDNWSHHTVKQITNELLEGDVQVYAMGIFDAAEYAGHQSPEERNGPTLLTKLAGETGGRLYTVDKLDQLPAISERISRELRSQYLLGYVPVHQNRDGKYHRVQVKLAEPEARPELRAYYRLGYYDTEH